jgi:hypothetical protein
VDGAGVAAAVAVAMAASRAGAADGPAVAAQAAKSRSRDASPIISQPMAVQAVWPVAALQGYLARGSRRTSPADRALAPQLRHRLRFRVPGLVEGIAHASRQFGVAFLHWGAAPDQQDLQLGIAAEYLYGGTLDVTEQSSAPVAVGGAATWSARTTTPESCSFAAHVEWKL